MRIGAIVEIPLTNGGGFNQSLNAVLQMKRICGGRHEVVVFTSCRDDLGYLESLGIKAFVLPDRPLDSLYLPFRKHPVFQKLQNWTGIGTNLEKALLGSGVDIAYFVGHTSSPLSLRSLGYITTVWDVCHLDQPEFPEVSAAGEFENRERAFFQALTRAVAVVCASPSLGRKLQAHYGVASERIISIPFAPSPFLSATGALGRAEVMRAYGLEPGYYFYPAQFWPHKNHVRILQAMARLRRRGLSRQVVFSGKDHGNLAHVMSVAKQLGLEDSVRVLGFVPPNHMRGLYEGALALVMPTYFGPTNIPPLEAWSLGCPVVYSRHLAEQAGDAALFADPDSSEELESALAELEDPAVRAVLVENGVRRLQDIALEAQVGEAALLASVESCARRMECWQRAE